MAKKVNHCGKVLLCEPKYKLLKLLVRLFNIVIDDNLIMIALRVGVLKFDFGPDEPFLNFLLALSSATSETRLECFKAGWFNENIPSIDAGVRLQLLDTVYFDIQDHYQPFASQIIDGLLARAVVVATETCVFHETVLREKR